MMSFGSPEWKLAPWTRPVEEAAPYVRRALEAGINFFDTADVYSNGLSEQITGRLLKEYARRDEVVIATKVFFGAHLDAGPKPNQIGLSRKHIVEEVNDSLQRLGVDYVDLLYIHRWDAATPIEETMEALHDLVRAGKALYIGASSMYAWQFAKAQYTSRLHAWTPFVAMQNHYNLVYREEEREMIPFCVDQGAGIVAWSPLARGFLASNRTRERAAVTERGATDTWAHDAYCLDSDFDVVDAVREVANERGVSPAQIALAWVLNMPFVTAPIVGATRLQHLEEAIAATELTLSAGEVARLERHYQAHPVAGPM
jgi:aryl-alcohol dehydrogenase-like predicted oxidoreductase